MEKAKEREQIDIFSVAKKLGMTTEAKRKPLLFAMEFPTIRQEYVALLLVIAKALNASTQRTCECPKCEKRFRITSAEKSKIYRCPNCFNDLKDLPENVALELKMEDTELMLDDSIPPEAQKAIQDPNNIFAHFVLIERVAKGTLGDVYKAFDFESLKTVALKFIPAEKVDDLKFEVRTLMSLEHKNIAAVYDIAKHDDKGFISAQFINGKPLPQVELDEKKALDIMQQACDAVAYAHKRTIIHGNIKPQNIFVEENRNVFVTDFCIAAKEQNKDVFAGTPGFMAPEVALGIGAVPASDVYSLGATLYFALTGKCPTPVDANLNPQAAIHKIATGAIVPIRELKPEISPDLEAIVNKALAPESANRYPTAAELAEDLRRYIAGEPVSAFEGGFGYRLKKMFARLLRL